MNTKLMKLKKKKGFTLIELIIVIAIIGIIAAIAIPNFSKVQKNAKIDADIATGRSIANAVTVLMAEGKIVAGTLTLAASGNTAASDELDIENYMKSGSLKLQTPGVAFPLTIVIDSDGNCVISDAAASAANTLYPTQTGKFQK